MVGDEPHRRSRKVAEILARTICPDRADWSAETARYLLGLRFADHDLDRFHALLAGHYADTLDTKEQAELERYQFVNCLAEMMRARARRSLAKTKANP